MRSAVALGLLVLLGCSKSPGPKAAAAPEPVELEISAPAVAPASMIREAIARTSIPAGAFAVSLSTTLRHGCSRSWQMTSIRAKAKLELGGGVASLDVDRETITTSGSFGVRGDPSTSREATVAKLRGTFSELEPGKLQASLSPVSCEGDCDPRSVELICEVRRIPVDEREPGAERSPDGTLRSGGAVDGVVCTGLDSLLGRYTATEIPLAPGAGVEVDRDEYGYGEGSSKTYRAIAAVAP